MHLHTLLTTALVLSTSLAARADTLAGTTAGANDIGGSFYLGQSFTTSEAGSNISFNYYTHGSAPYATGTGFLFSEAYTGNPAGLSASDPGFLGSAAAGNGEYSFGSGLSLLDNTQYFFYENGLIPAGSITGGATIAGGNLYYSQSGNFVGAGNSANFLVSGSSETAVTPEPTTLLLLCTGMLGVLGSARCRRQPPPQQVSARRAGAFGSP